MEARGRNVRAQWPTGENNYVGSWSPAFGTSTISLDAIKSQINPNKDNNNCSIY
jgi:hypothetical protein